MKQLEISDYQKLNDSFHKRLVYHVGIDCGFFVELNNMINGSNFIPKMPTSGQARDGQNTSSLSVRKSMSHSIISTTYSINPYGDAY